MCFRYRTRSTGWDWLNARRVTMFTAALAWVALALAVTPATAQDKMELRPVTHGVYMMENSRGSGNSSFVTNDGVVVFDADIRTADQCSPRSAS